jgi:hypothetical protein
MTIWRGHDPRRRQDEMQCEAKTMVAFHGDPAIKERYLSRVRGHREADEIVQWYGYWHGGRGCAIGCTLHSDDHAAYETELGIPRAIAQLEDGIFEGLEVGLARQWPERFLAAITPGADLSRVLPQFFVWLLVDPTDGVLRFAKTDKARAAIQAVANLYGRKLTGEVISSDEWRKAAWEVEAPAAAAPAAAAWAAWAEAAAAWEVEAPAAAAAWAAAEAVEPVSRELASAKQADKLVGLLEAA